MIIKLTTAGKNEVIYVNFDYVRTMRRDNSFTELTMSDDKYHKLVVAETPEKIYEMLYPVSKNTRQDEPPAMSAAVLEADKVPTEAQAAPKKPATKKATTKPEE